MNTNFRITPGTMQAAVESMKSVNAVCNSKMLSTMEELAKDAMSNKRANRAEQILSKITMLKNESEEK